MSELSIQEKIRNTLHIYDPEAVTICVGSAALALQFESMGWDRPVSDVDTLASQEYINKLNTRLVADNVGGYAWADPHFQYRHMTDHNQRSMSLVPKMEYSNQILKYQTFTEIRDDYHTARFSPDLPVNTTDGIQCLDAGEVLLWKARIKRATDKETIEYTLANDTIREHLGEVAHELEILMSKTPTLVTHHEPGCGCYFCF